MQIKKVQEQKVSDSPPRQSFFSRQAKEPLLEIFPSAANSSSSHHFYKKHAAVAALSLKGKRPDQEDGSLIAELNTHLFRGLTTREIGNRLWTAMHQLDETLYQNKVEGGSTAIVALILHSTLITATLGDSEAFLVSYNNRGAVRQVISLCKRLHAPSLPEETFRIRQAGGDVSFSGRVNGKLAVSRALGDFALKEPAALVSSDADILLYPLPEKDLLKYKYQLILACDGLTEKQKEDHAVYIREILHCHGSPGRLTEAELATVLAKANKATRDNVSVTVKTLQNPSSPWLLGIFDGHNGKLASSFAAQNFKNLFVQTCRYTKNQYQQLKYSTNNNLLAFLTDNLPLLCPRNLAESSLDQSIHYKSLQPDFNAAAQYIWNLPDNVQSLTLSGEKLNLNQLEILFHLLPRQIKELDLTDCSLYPEYFLPKELLTQVPTLLERLYLPKIHLERQKDGTFEEVKGYSLQMGI